jgi:asparagine synthase (glutamine-hydrolysing)
MSLKILKDSVLYGSPSQEGFIGPSGLSLREASSDALFMKGDVYSLKSRSGEALLPILQNPGLLNSMESDASIISYDKSRDSLLLLRDPSGATPLFYHEDEDGTVAAAFDLPSLFKLLKKPPLAREDVLYDFLATHYRYVFRIPDRTFHERVYQVPAGHFVLFGDKGKLRSPYIDLSFDPEAQKMSFKEAADHYLNRLRENTLFRLEALKGVKYAFTVSSGLDSATVASLAAEKLREPIDAFYMAYSSAKGTPYDESEGVKALVDYKGWRLHPLELSSPDLLSETKELMEKTLAPSVTVTWLANYALSKYARSMGFERLFSGLGGDESLAGEFEHFFVFFADLYFSGQKELLDKETEAWKRLHDHPVFKKGPEVRDAYFQRNLDFTTRAIRPDPLRYSQNRSYFDPDWVLAMEASIPPPPMPTPYPFFLSNRLFEEMSYETSPPTMWSEALSSSAGGIKGVFPMASPYLFRLAYSLPGTFKYENGFTKMLLRRSTKGLLPDSSRLNPVKTGFNAPLDMWLKDPKTAKDALELIKGSKLAKKGWLKKGAIDQIVEEHLKGSHNHMMLLWPLISTAIFLDLEKSA